MKDHVAEGILAADDALADPGDHRGEVGGAHHLIAAVGQRRSAGRQELVDLLAGEATENTGENDCSFSW